MYVRTYMSMYWLPCARIFKFFGGNFTEWRWQTMQNLITNIAHRKRTGIRRQVHKNNVFFDFEVLGTSGPIHFFEIVNWTQVKCWTLSPTDNVEQISLYSNRVKMFTATSKYGLDLFNLLDTRHQIYFDAKKLRWNNVNCRSKQIEWNEEHCNKLKW